MHRFVPLIMAILSATVAHTGEPGTRPDAARIGVVLMLDAQPRQVHAGTTRFQNWEREAISDWKIPSTTLDLLKSAINPNLPEPVVLEAPPELKSLRLNLFAAGWTAAKPRKEVVPILEKLAADNALSHLIVVAPWEGNFSQTSVPVHGYGVFTRCFAASCEMRALAHFGINVFAANPLKLFPPKGGVVVDHNPLPVTFGSNQVKELLPEVVDVAKDPIVLALQEAIRRALDKTGLAAPTDGG
jgi:hypothetical protein